MARNVGNKKFSDGNRDLIEEIVTWNTCDVNNYLIRNNIYGCGSALETHSIDGEAFLFLNHQKMLPWGIPAIKRSKILVLLNGLGSEDYRKDIAIKANISSRLHTATSCLQTSMITTPGAESLHTSNRSNKLPISGSPLIFSSQQPKASTLVPDKCQKSFGITREMLSKVSLEHRQLPGGPPLPPKPDHLRPHTTNQNHSNVDKFPKNVVNVKREAADSDKHTIPISTPSRYVNEEIVFKHSGHSGSLPPGWRNVTKHTQPMVNEESEKYEDDTSYEIPNDSFSSQTSMQPQACVDDTSYEIPISNFLPQINEPYGDDESYEIPNSNFSHQRNDQTFANPSSSLNDDFYYEDDFSSDSEDVEPQDFLVPPPQFQDKRQRKRGIFLGIFGSRRNSGEDKFVDGDPCGTPPIPPSRIQNSSRCSSEASLSHSTESQSQTPPPTLPPLPPLPPIHSRKISTLSSSSQSSLAETPTPPGFPIRTMQRKTPPVCRPSPVPSESSSVAFGSQTLMPLSAGRSRGQSPSQSLSSSNRSSETSSDSNTTIHSWFLNVDRKQSEDILKDLDNGTFLVRPSKHGGSDAPVTLSLQYNKRIFHILIRKRTDGKLALGTEKIGEAAFSSLVELVEHHHVTPMYLHSGDEVAGETYLMQWPEIMQ